MFRRQINAAIPDEHIFVTAVRFEGDDIIEADLVMEASGRKIRFDVHERCRFVDDMLAERWARVDFEASSASSPAPFNRAQDAWGEPEFNSHLVHHLPSFAT